MTSVIGQGAPGPHTRALMQDFTQLAAAWARGD